MNPDISVQMDKDGRRYIVLKYKLATHEMRGAHRGDVTAKNCVKRLSKLSNSLRKIGLKS